MKRVSVLVGFFFLFGATTAMAYQEVICQEKASGKPLKGYRYPILPLRAILDDCLSRSDLKLEIVLGKPFLPDEERPVFQDPFTGETFSPDKRLDVAICYRPGKYYKEYDEYIQRLDLESFALSEPSDPDEARVKDLNNALSTCLTKYSANELVGR